MIGTVQLLQAPCVLNGILGVTTYDGGAQLNLIDRAYLEKAGFTQEPQATGPLNVSDLQGRPIQTQGTVVIQLDLAPSATYTVECVVVDNLLSEVLIGRPFMKKIKAIVHHGDDVLRLGRLRIDCSVRKDMTMPAIACVLKRTRLPPNSVQRVKVHFSTPPAQGVVYECRGSER